MTEPRPELRTKGIEARGEERLLRDLADPSLDANCTPDPFDGGCPEDCADSEAGLVPRISPAPERARLYLVVGRDGADRYVHCVSLTELERLCAGAGIEPKTIIAVSVERPPRRW